MSVTQSVCDSETNYADIEDIEQHDKKMYCAVCWLHTNRNIFLKAVYEPAILPKSIEERQEIFQNHESKLAGLFDPELSFEENENLKHDYMSNFTFVFEDVK